MCVYDGWACFIEVHTSRWKSSRLNMWVTFGIFYVCIWWIGMFHRSAYIWTKSFRSIGWQYLEYYYVCILWLVMFHKKCIYLSRWDILDPIFEWHLAYLSVHMRHSRSNLWMTFEVLKCAYDWWACSTEVHTFRWEVLDPICQWHLE